MRRILIFIVLLVALSLLWVFGGRELSLTIDQFGTIETASSPVNAIVYQGNGVGGTIQLGTYQLSLSPADRRAEPPHVGSSKDDQLALANAGQVFAFGPFRSSEKESLAADLQPGDTASVAIRHSLVSWPTFFDFNFMTGHSPLWKRHQLYDLVWRRQNGAKLEMLWRYEQSFYHEDGWTAGLGTREGVTGLIRVDISNSAR
jgi:hypothetical protein